MLIVKPQTIDDNVIKNIFGANSHGTCEIRTVFVGLQDGELIIKVKMHFAIDI